MHQNNTSKTYCTCSLINAHPRSYSRRIYSNHSYNCPCFILILRIHPSSPSLSFHQASLHSQPCLDFNLLSTPALCLSLYLSQAYCCCISSLIFFFCSLPSVSLPPFNLHSLLSAFISPFIFVLLQTQVFVYTHGHIHVHTVTHTHTCTHLFGHAGICRSQCR